MNLTEILFPFCDDFVASGLDDFHNVPQSPLRNLGPVVTQITLSCGGDPDFSSAAGRRAFRNMNVNRFQWITFIGPEINPVRADFKNLRHCQSHLPAQTGESNGLWSE